MYKKFKEKISIVLVLLLVIIIPQVSLASSVSLISSASVTEPDKTFTLSIYVNPESTVSYTAKTDISFPADLVSVESFTYAPTWLPIDKPGYDLIDNTSGKLIKTAGYPSGFSQETLLGTVVLKAKSAGVITISTDQESYVLDEDGNNTLNTYGSSSVTSYVPLSDYFSYFLL